MNELGLYFTRHPLENPANYLGTDFDPAGSAAYRQRVRAWRERYRARPRAPAGAPWYGARAAPAQAPFTAGIPSGGCRAFSC